MVGNVVVQKTEFKLNLRKILKSLRLTKSKVICMNGNNSLRNLTQLHEKHSCEISET